jgi:isocitrate lyase
MSVQEIKAAIRALPDADFQEVSCAVDEMEAERFDQALDQAAQSGKFDPWLKKIDADIDAGRVKPLNVWRQARSAARLACYQAI